MKYVVRKKNGQNQKAIIKVLKRNDQYSIINAYSTEECKALGIDEKTYNKILQYDTILLYPTNID